MHKCPVRCIVATISLTYDEPEQEFVPVMKQIGTNELSEPTCDNSHPNAQFIRSAQFGRI